MPLAMQRQSRRQAQNDVFLRWWEETAIFQWAPVVKRQRLAAFGCGCYMEIKPASGWQQYASRGRTR